jgi:hypothetical protein
MTQMTDGNTAARNPVQHTRLLAFAVKAQFVLGLRRQKPSR